MKQSKGLQKRALKAGRRASTHKGCVLSRDELLGIKIQIVPAWGRLTLFAVGLIALVCGVLAWPWDHLLFQILEVIVGLVLMCGGIFGLKKTLSTIVENIDIGQGADLFELVAEGVGTAIGAVLDV